MKIGKIMLVAGMGLLLSTSALNKAVDPHTPYQYVSEVLGMQNSFHDPNLMWRAVESPVLIWLAVFVVICTQAMSGIACLWGAVDMLRGWKDTDQFNASKDIAIRSLNLVAVFYLLGLLVVCGEWFVVWQNPDSHLLEDAFRGFVMAMLILFWVRDSDE